MKKENTDVIFAQNLAKALKKQGLSQKALADKCGGDPFF